MGGRFNSLFCHLEFTSESSIVVSFKLEETVNAWELFFYFDHNNRIDLLHWQHNTSVPHVGQNSAPCPTLFVANLGPTCTEQELIQVFSRLVSIFWSCIPCQHSLKIQFNLFVSIRCPGFLKLKMQSTYGAPVAFVDFQVPMSLVVL